MSTPRLVPAPISIVFSEADLNKKAYEREYQQLSESDDDPISQWLKLAKARGETAESDPVLLNLMIELHRKIDALEMFLKNETPKSILSWKNLCYKRAKSITDVLPCLFIQNVILVFFLRQFLLL